MSSTNKTTNYDLSQYIGSDKPTYLTDYNGDMSKIDAQMKVNADNIATALNGVQTATTTANTANSTANTANTNANTANATANSAITDLNNFKTSMTLSVFKSLTSSDIVSSDYTSQTIVGFNVAKSSDSATFKIYGLIEAQTGNSLGSKSIVFENTGLVVPSGSEFFISCAGYASKAGSTQPSHPVDIYVENDKITLSTWDDGGSGTVLIVLHPCLYFNANFGDTPSNN